MGQHFELEVAFYSGQLEFHGICEKTYQGLLELVGLDASDEEGVALSERLHQQVRRLLELRRQSHLEKMEHLL